MHLDKVKTREVKEGGGCWDADGKRCLVKYMLRIAEWAIVEGAHSVHGGNINPSARNNEMKCSPSNFGRQDQDARFGGLQCMPCQPQSAA